MASQYRRGADFERKLKKREEENGAIFVLRSAGSKGPIDVVAIHPWGVKLIQAKLGKPTKADRERIKALEWLLSTSCDVYCECWLITPSTEERISF